MYLANDCLCMTINNYTIYILGFLFNIPLLFITLNTCLLVIRLQYFVNKFESYMTKVVKLINGLQLPSVVLKCFMYLNTGAENNVLFIF